MEYHFSGCVRSDLEKIKYFVDNRIRELNRYIDDEDKLFDIRLVVNELVINGALHGNNMSDIKTVYLNIDLVDGKLTIQVQDEGQGVTFDIEKDYRPEKMMSSGRGLVLVNALVDKLILNKNLIIAVLDL